MALLRRYVEAEKMNGRWAMAAVAGIMGQELLGVSTSWFEAGAQDYWIPNNGLLALEFLIIGHFEVKRYQGWTKYKTVRQSGINAGTHQT